MIMTNEIYELLSTVADDNGLEIVETTDGVNGYPSHLSYAIIGFHDEAEINAVKKELNDGLKELINDEESNVESDLSVSELDLHKRDGWQLWERSQYCGLYDIEGSYNDKDGYRVYKKEDYEDEEEFIDMEMRDRLVDFDKFDKLIKFIEEMRCLYYDIDVLDEGEVLVYHVDSGERFSSCSKGTRDYYDTHHRAIALTID